MSSRVATRIVGALSLVAATAAAPSVGAASTPPIQAWGSMLSAPSGARAELHGVTAPGESDVWAVGAFNPGRPPTAVLTDLYAEHWDGTRWTAMSPPTPAVYGASQEADLAAVTSTSRTDVWAVGSLSDRGSLASQTLTYRFDGSQWSRVPSPNPAGVTGTNHLYAVAARSASSVWAVGDTGYPNRSLALRWNGSAWRRVAVPDVGPLRAVAVEAGTTWLAGGSRVVRYAGGAGAVLPTPPTAATGYLSIGGLAATADGLVAVGTVQIPYFDGYRVVGWAARWAGSTWTQIPIGAPKAAVTAGSGGVWAVGQDVERIVGSGSLAAASTWPPSAP